MFGGLQKTSIMFLQKLISMTGMNSVQPTQPKELKLEVLEGHILKWSDKKKKKKKEI